MNKGSCDYGAVELDVSSDELMSQVFHHMLCSYSLLSHSLSLQCDKGNPQVALWCQLCLPPKLQQQVIFFSFVVLYCINLTKQTHTLYTKLASVNEHC